MTRQCKRCLESKPLIQFDGKRRVCRACRSQEREEFRDASRLKRITSKACVDCGLNPKANNDSYCKPCRNTRTRATKFRLTPYEYEAKFAAQKGICYLCPRPATDLDHNHKSGQIRKCLCRRCNLIVGHIERGSTTQWPSQYYSYIAEI